jgi:hypothetical protein
MRRFMRRFSLVLIKTPQMHRCITTNLYICGVNKISIRYSDLAFFWMFST